MRPHGGRSERQGVISDSGGGRPFWGAVEGDWAQERSVQKVPSATARVRRAGHVTYITPLDALSFSEKAKLKVLVAQLCPTLCDPMDCSLPGSSIRGILQARILEGVAISFSRGSSRPRDRTLVSHTVGRLYRLSHQRRADRKPYPAFIVP